MKKLKTISEHDIIQAAWLYYSNLLNEERENAETSERLLGRKAYLFEERVKKYTAIEEELHALLLALETKA